MEEFKEKFIEDALVLVSRLESTVLTLEHESSNMDLVQEIFRTMHTLKGVSSMYGFANISEFTHQMESIYNLIRNGTALLSREIMNLTLVSVDHLKNLLADSKFENANNQKRHDELLNKIAQLLSSLGFSENKTVKQNSVKPIETSNLKTYYILFKIEERFLDRGIKILSIFRELSLLGEYTILPEENTDDSLVDRYTGDWRIYLVTKESIRAVEDAFMFVIDSCKIIKIANCNLFSEEDFLNGINNKASILSVAQNAMEHESLIEQESNNELDEPKQLNLEKVQEEKAPETIDLNYANNKNFQEIGKQITSRISVDAEKLDQLMYLVSELVITRAELGLIVKDQDFAKLILLEDKIDKLTKQFRDNTLSIRLVPINDILVSFRRLIRDLSISMNKEIRFITQGTENELDKNIIDVLTEPLLHIIRNCIDHGIETPQERVAKGKPREGVIKLTAFHSGNNVFIQIQDDGKGIDPDEIRKRAIEKGHIASDAQLTKKQIYDLIFIAGFSTANVITEVSGRGVGMDVVKKKINSVRGEIEIDSEVGLGTYFTIKLQQTISIIDTLMLETSDSHFLVALSDVEFCGSQTIEEFSITQNMHLEYNGTLIPYIHLRNELKLSGNDGDKLRYVVLNRNSNRFAIVIDKIIGEYQAVLKPLGNSLKRYEFLSGASIMGDGKLALMLNTDKLLSHSQSKNK